MVGEAGDGEQALRLARELGPDLVVMDVKMPKVDGLTAARQITAEGPAVLILTAFSDKELVEEAADAGTIGYLVKPFQPAQLLAGVSVALAGRPTAASSRARSTTSSPSWPPAR